jgi:hypothetical protein
MTNLEFKIELSVAHKEKVDYFSRGHFSIMCNQYIISSIEKSPDQSMLIFFFIVQLLDGTKKIISSKEENSHHFVGEDSSFQFIARRNGDMIFIEKVNGSRLCEIQKNIFVVLLWNEIQGFLEENRKFINDSDLIYKDLLDAINQFKEEFKMIIEN